MGKENIVAQASVLPLCQLPYKECGKMTCQKLLEEGKPSTTRDRGRFETQANWQVSHQYWLSPALACLPGGGGMARELVISCFTLELHRLFQKLLQTLRKPHLSVLRPGAQRRARGD